MRIVQEFTKGFWKELPPFKLVLGLCPTLGVTTTAYAGIGMGLATTFVLVCSNILVSSLRSVIPSKVRIAAYVVIIAAFVVMVEMATQAWVFPLYKGLGVFIPLIVVNCIVLGRAEAFAAKNGVMLSIADGAGIGLGYTIALGVLGALREVTGTGALLGSAFLPFMPGPIQVMPAAFKPFLFATLAPGAFVFLGIMLGVINLVSVKK